MDLTQLAAKQKRIKDWTDFIADGGVQEPKLRTYVSETLDQFKKLLARCWEAQQINEADEAQIRDFERRLEQLNEESRMRVVGKKPAAHPRVI